MAAWQREINSCVGRGVDANGLLGRFAAWVVRAPQADGLGGPAWFILDNMLSSPPRPGIVISSMAAPTPNQMPKLIHVYYDVANPSNLIFAPCYYWNVATHAGYYWSRSQVHSLDGGGFNYWFFGGPESIAVFTRIGSNQPTMFILDEFDGDLNLLEPESVGSTLTQSPHIETGDTQNQISQLYNLTGVMSHLDPTANLSYATDSQGRLRFSTVVSAGNMQVFIYGGPALDVLIGQTNNTASLGTRTVTPPSGVSSGIGGTINVDLISGTTSNPNIYHRFNRVDVQAGAGANFQTGNLYSIVDHSGYTPRMSYSKVLGRSGDTLILDYLRPGRNFQAGSVISPYPMRLYTLGFGHWYLAQAGTTNSATNAFNNTFWALPMFSRRFYEYDSGNQSAVTYASSAEAAITYPSPYMQRANPNKKGNRIVSRPFLFEWYTPNENSSQTDMTEGFGRPLNVIAVPHWGGANMGDLINNGANQYLLFANNGSVGYAIRYNTSLV